MTPETRAAAQNHALAAYPKEACGLIIVQEGVERYLACRNIASSKREHFILDPKDYARAEDLGEIVAVVHSHPDAHCRPSEADRVSCELSGLPWYIFSVYKDEHGNLAIAGEEAFEPSGYKAPLIGRQFSHGVLDCYTLVRDYYAWELGIELPNFHRDDDWWSKGENLYLENYEASGFEQITGKPQVGDIILMQIRSKVPNHAGVYVGDGQFIHHLYGRLSSRDVYGGYWQEVTRLIIRRKPGG